MISFWFAMLACPDCAVCPPPTQRCATGRRRRLFKTSPKPASYDLGLMVVFRKTRKIGSRVNREFI
jgi:hypothetical protein